MAATDTIVGIVGAVLLAGIMVAVFVYEASNPPADPGAEPTWPQKVEAWETAHPGLRATEDMDNDGTVNLNDTDMDDDGTLDANQTHDLRRVITESGTYPAASRDHTHAVPVTVHSGAERIQAYLNWTTQTPEPLHLPVFTCGLEGGGETTPCTGDSAAQSTTHSRSLTRESEIPPGNYTFRVNVAPASPGPGTTYTVTIVISYGPARAPPSEPISPR